MHTSRRQFLKTSLRASTLLAFSPAVPAFLSWSALAGTARRNDRQTVLVVIQLSGGNDGLNTVIPFGDDVYHRSRPTLRLPPNRVLKLDQQLGLHPEMKAFQRLYDERCLTIVQGVGYPQSKRDHPVAKRDWQTAIPTDANCQTGWLGRAIDRAGEGTAEVPGLFVGHILEPLGLQTERKVVPALRSLNQWTLPAKYPAAFRNTLAQREVQMAQLEHGRADDSLLDFLRQGTAEACAVSDRVEAVAKGRSLSAAGYPQYGLAQTLHTIARLIRAEAGVRIFYAEMGGGGIGGFDSHANQAANHGALLHELAESVTAFISDLRRDKLHDRVLLLTFSEFGRTVTENGRHGTDHGAAAPMFLAGGRLKGGLAGAHPSLRDLSADGLKFHTDFRRVYATALDRWLGFDSPAILNGRFQPLDILAV